MLPSLIGSPVAVRKPASVASWPMRSALIPTFALTYPVGFPAALRMTPRSSPVTPGLSPMLIPP